MSSPTTLRRVRVGIFVGGASRRMGRPKGLLLEPQSPRARSSDGGPEPRRTLVERLAGEARRGFATTSDLAFAGVVLVGARPEYDPLAWSALTDARPDAGPLGGLVAFLEHAAGEGDDWVLALACDQPYVSAALLRRVLTEHPRAKACAPRVQGGRWQPLCARYDVASALPLAHDALARGELALWRLLERLGAAHLALSPDEQELLADWDHPEDVECS